MGSMEMNGKFRRQSIALIAAGGLLSVAACTPETPAEPPTETVTAEQTTSTGPTTDPTTEAPATTAAPEETPTSAAPSTEDSEPAPPEPTDDGGTGRPTGPIEESLQAGATAHTRYFDVTVHGRDFTDTATGVEVEVCYAAAHPEANADGTTRVSTDPWRFGVYDGETQLESDVQFLPVTEFEPTTAFTPAYEETQLQVGECNTGWIAVEHGNPDLAWASVRYQPGDFGDVITWDLTES